MGVYGVVRDGDDDNDPIIPNVTIQVTGDDDPYKGPYYATTDSDGFYGIVFGEFGEVGRVKFTAKVYGNNVSSEERVWETDKDCHDEDNIQVMKINWAK